MTAHHHSTPSQPVCTPLSGSWIDFHHPNPLEGGYWNETTRRFTCEDWRTKVAEMAAFGIDTLVVESVMLRGKSFYPSKWVPAQWDHACRDPLGAVFQEADRHGMTVYPGVGFFSEQTGKTEADDREQILRREVPLELHARYGHHRSFAGWYLPVEAPIQGYFPEDYIRYVNELAAHCKKPDASRKILIAPYGTRTVKADQHYVEQLRRLEADHMAYQDEVGVQKTTPSELDAIFRRLRECHDQAGKPLWADVEIFSFEGPVYGSRLVPAPFERVRAQIEAVSPHAEKLLCYQYLGMVNSSVNNVYAGHARSLEFARDYRLWVRTRLGCAAERS